jgi:Tfp pilus assembly protein PilF
VFASALRIDPTANDAALGLARIDMTEGRLDEARKNLSGMLDRGDNSEARLLLAEIEQAKGNPPSSLEHYRRVLAANPNDVTALNNLAFMLAESASGMDEALRLAQRALELAPDSTTVADTMGWVMYRKGLYDSAVRYFEKAASKEGPVTQYHLAMAYFKAGNRNRGNQVLEAALRQNPNLPEAQIAKKAQAEADLSK